MLNNKILWGIIVGASVVFLYIYISNHRSPVSVVRVPILVYHNVRFVSSQPFSTDSAVSPELLERHLLYLKEHGYASISFSALLAYFAKGTPLPEKAVILTFDDSWKGQFVHALPLLKKYGYTATFFVWTDMVGQHDRLSWTDLEQLARNGMSIGGHGKSHASLVGLGSEALQEEVRKDKEIIEERIGSYIDVFAYPFGFYDEEVVEEVMQAGYKVARSIGHEVFHTKEDVFSLKGVGISSAYENLGFILE